MPPLPDRDSAAPPAADSAAEPAVLYGLVLAGGESVRMRRDKALLAYHGKPQAVHAFELLAARCRRVFLSCRPGQAERPGLEALPKLLDANGCPGPLAGILTALEAHPGAAWLVAACDLPFLDAAAVDALIAGRDPSRLATAFAGPLEARASEGPKRHGSRNAVDTSGEPARPRLRDLPDLGLGPEGALPEPLFAIYEPAMGPRIRELMAFGLDCPRRAIVKSHSRVLPAPGARVLENVNLPEEYLRALGDLSGRPPGPPV
jgi:molybdopterin-guanine dinucleotide biosynthesis protein A